MKVAMVSEEQLHQAYILGGMITSTIYDLAQSREVGTLEEVEILTAELKTYKTKWRDLQKKVFGE